MVPINWRFLHHLFFLVFCNVLVISEAVENRPKSAGGDLIVASSIAVNTFKIQTTAPRAADNKKYGYPYLIAPTLKPFAINSRSDEEDNEAILPVALGKPYGGKLSTSESESSAVKKNNPKKQKTPFTYGADRRQGDDEDIEVQGLRRYKEPKYRNFDELESRFRPRRIDVPYSEYYRPKASRRPVVSQRDPYRSPSKEPVDTFYPVTKPRSYKPSYKQRHNSPVYGNGRYEEPVNYYGGDSHSGYSNYESSTKYPSEEDTYYQADYTIESNKPIVGDIRKRLLDYAGASDLYEGEPDYLRQVAQNKYKYGQIGNDYYAYGGPEYKKSYREYPYVESKITLIKKSRSS